MRESGRSPDAVEIAGLVEALGTLLGRPEGLGEAFHDAMLRRMRILATLAQGLEQCPNPRRAVDAELLVNRDVQTHVEEGVGLPSLGAEILVEDVLAGLEHGLIFGVLADHADDLRLDQL